MVLQDEDCSYVVVSEHSCVVEVRLYAVAGEPVEQHFFAVPLLHFAHAALPDVAAQLPDESLHVAEAGFDGLQYVDVY